MPKKPKTNNATPRSEVQQDAAPCNEPQRDATPSNTPKRETKQSVIIQLLSREEGATMAELINATGWKPHSVRGHISNMRKKQKADIETSTNSEGNRIYKMLVIYNA